MEMKKILVPIDGSEPSKNAFKLALALASKMDSEVILLNVADVNEMTYTVEQFDILTDSYFGKKDMPAGEYKDYRADVFKAANEKGNELTRELVEQIPEGITYTVTTKIGTPGPTIVNNHPVKKTANTNVFTVFLLHISLLPDGRRPAGTGYRFLHHQVSS